MMMGGTVIYYTSIRFNPNRWDFLNFDHIYILHFPVFRSHNTLIRWVSTFLNEL